MGVPARKNFSTAIIHLYLRGKRVGARGGGGGGGGGGGVVERRTVEVTENILVAPQLHLFFHYIDLGSLL